jgi:hypothetical protein
MNGERESDAVSRHRHGDRDRHGMLDWPGSELRGERQIEFLIVLAMSAVCPVLDILSASPQSSEPEKSCNRPL